MYEHTLYCLHPLRKCWKHLAYYKFPKRNTGIRTRWSLNMFSFFREQCASWSPFFSLLPFTPPSHSPRRIRVSLVLNLSHCVVCIFRAHSGSCSLAAAVWCVREGCGPCRHRQTPPWWDRHSHRCLNFLFGRNENAQVSRNDCIWLD